VGCEVILFVVMRGSGLMSMRPQHVKLGCSLM
jgi:hypothetical protein